MFIAGTKLKQESEGGKQNTEKRKCETEERETRARERKRNGKRGEERQRLKKRMINEKKKFNSRVRRTKKQMLIKVNNGINIMEIKRKRKLV